MFSEGLGAASSALEDDKIFAAGASGSEGCALVVKRESSEWLTTGAGCSGGVREISGEEKAQQKAMIVENSKTHLRGCRTGVGPGGCNCLYITVPANRGSWTIWSHSLPGTVF